MKRILTTFAALAISASISFAEEANKDAAPATPATPASPATPATPATPAAPAPAAGDAKKGDPDKAFARKDKDNDGSLSKEEFTAGAKDATRAEKAFGRRDANSDGKISKEEFATAPARKK